jgi:surface protein
MFGMFKNSGLESIDISSFDTKKVTNMRDLFGNYTSLILMECLKSVFYWNL